MRPHPESASNPTPNTSLRASAPQLRAKSRRKAAVALCTRLRAQWRGNPQGEDNGIWELDWLDFCVVREYNSVR